MLLVFGWVFFCPVVGGETLSDPTRPPVMTLGRPLPNAQEPMQWQLSATVIGPQRRVAVINEQALQVGQKIDGAELLAVEPGSALLLHRGREMQLKLNSITVKQALKVTP